jgi:hypothetical protein
MSTRFTIKQGDSLPLLRAQLFEDVALTTPTDLTNADGILIKVGRVTGDNILGFLVIEKPCTIENHQEGRIQVQITSVESTLSPGTYDGEFEVTWTGPAPPDISTYPKIGFFEFVVEKDLDTFA